MAKDELRKEEETYKQRCIRKAAETPQEVKQKLLDLVWSGKTLGEAGESLGLEFEAYIQILYENISTAHYLNTEATND